MTTRKQIVEISTQILRGERNGDKIAAYIARDQIVWQETLDLLDMQITDAEMDARIVAAVAEAKDTGIYKGVPISSLF